MSLSLSVTRDQLGADVLAALRPEEVELVADVSARSDTASLVLRQAGAVIGYAVFGWDAAEMVTVYAARCWNNMLARAAMMGIFGAAQVAGSPLRVHADKLRTMARYMGAKDAFAAIDGDGIPMGVFDGK